MRRFTIFLFLFAALWFLALEAEAASLKMGPSAGTFTVGSTFDVSIFLDTEGESVNALEVSLSFPPDKLQLVSPSTGQSIISIYTSQPRFNNATGRIDLQGGMPGGVNVSNGLVTTLTFRVRSVGAAILRFLDVSKVLLHDGLGTDALRDTQNGVYNLVLPAPQGPIVASETHPDQSRWYSNGSVILGWGSDAFVEGYSYVLNEEPIGNPDDISEGTKSNVVYRSVEDGTHYFHVKALRQGVWGGTTHFALNIDATPPAEFPVQIIPDTRTTSRKPVVQFITTDLSSGIDHYEIKIVPLNVAVPIYELGDQPLFVEAQSPYVTPELQNGSYDVIVRAYDKAGNSREVTQKLKIISTVFRFVQDEGLEIRGVFVVPWLLVWFTLALLTGILGYGALSARKWHHLHHFKVLGKELPHHLLKQIEELKTYRKKYGKTFSIFVLLLGLLGLLGVSGLPGKVSAQNTELAPPLITTVSRDISNEEIFYAGGKTDVTNASVILYLQNLQTGETQSQAIQSDRRGDWFYRHGTFLSTGNYLMWAQTKLGEQISPPSPQIQMAVSPTAIQFGASRLSYETLYLVLVIILTVAILALVAYIVFHSLNARRRYLEFKTQVKEAEDSIRRGFAILRHDIQGEIAVVKKMKLSKALSDEEKAKEEQLLRDLDLIEKYIGKEVWDIERLEATEKF